MILPFYAYAEGTSWISFCQDRNQTHNQHQDRNRSQEKACTYREAGGVGTHNLPDLAALLEQHEGGHLQTIGRTISHTNGCDRNAGATHRTDADLLRNVARLVYVDLVEVDGVGLIRELLKDRGDLLARAAPGRPEVEYRGAVALDLCLHTRMSSICAHVQAEMTYGFLELGDVGDDLDNHCSSCRARC